MKFDKYGNYAGYNLTGLNALDGFITASTNLGMSYITDSAVYKGLDYDAKYAISSGSKFLTGLTRAALYEGYDAITGSNSTAGMGLKNLAYSFSDTMGFFGSYYGSKLGEAAKKAAEDNATKRESTIGSAILPKDEKEGFRLISDEDRKELENFNRAVETKQYLDDKMNKGEPLTDNELLVYYELKNSLGEKLTADEKQEYKDIAKELKINLTDRLIDTSKGIVEDSKEYNQAMKALGYIKNYKQISRYSDFYQFNMNGQGYFSTNPASEGDTTKYGRYGLVETLDRAFQEWYAKNPDKKLGVNDLGYMIPGSARPAFSGGDNHSGDYSVDLSWITKNGSVGGGNYGPVVGGTETNSIYDRASTIEYLKTLIDSVPEGYKVSKIFFDDPEVIKEIRREYGAKFPIFPLQGEGWNHSNHIHFEVGRK